MWYTDQNSTHNRHAALQVSYGVSIVGSLGDKLQHNALQLQHFYELQIFMSSDCEIRFFYESINAMASDQINDIRVRRHIIP